MKSRFNSKCNSLLFLLICFSTSITSLAQDVENEKPNFFDNVSFGGGLGLSVGNGIFIASVSPTAVYHFNEYFSAGPGLQYSYQSGRNFNTSLYGASLLALANPHPQIQLSAEVEQIRFNINEEGFQQNSDGTISAVAFSENGWNTALFLGAGYRAGPATIGLRYNVLFRENDTIYASAFVPFVRVFF
jgi:hypothetical protein